MPEGEPLQRKLLYDFMAAQQFAVVASVSPVGAPEAALVQIAVTPDLEVIFETTDATRKYTNLRRNPRISLVIGWNDQRTVQYEGVADEPAGSELEKLKVIFFSAWPQLHSHEGWPGLTYFRAKPRWIRFSNYFSPRSIEEISFGSESLVPLNRKGLACRLQNTLADMIPYRNAGKS